MRRTHRYGFTIVELLVVVSIIALLIAILLPAIGKARDAALVTQSLGNLRNMGTANASYSADWSDRQFTAIPDDAGAVAGNCTTYINEVACPPQQLLGWAANGSMWGYFLGSSALCTWNVGNCGNWVVYKPMEFQGADGFGAFRLPNVKSFAGYVNNKFYDPVYWAPKDKINIAIAEKYWPLADQFTSVSQEIAFSSYCWSPAAMYPPDVLSKNGYKNPNSMSGGYRSPSVSMSTYPDLKTRMLEHSWLQHAESAVNSNFAGGNEPWYFNHGYNSAPATLFYDGHVGIMGVADAMESDGRAKATAPATQQQKGLWHRGTPFGGDGAGYFGAFTYDFIVNTSYHILTVDGIQGRDTIGAK
ncbi:MAG: prepilin-type N-terminal cleavage/methylation domain-containing protein [Phycisphaerae bacterium]|nr:prepilin-type N-terminal cleavage/methylation domain-containing protein [Phycisphaerae bacterium]